MKSKILNIFLLVAVLMAAACSEHEDPSGSNYSGTLSFQVTTADEAETRSSITAPDNILKEAIIAVYTSDGVLLEQHSFTELTEMTLTLPTGRTYYLYALFNIHAVNFPARLADISSFSVPWGDVSSINANGIPMAWEGGVEFDTSGQTVTMTATRLVAKYTFSIDRSALQGNFTVTSLTVCNAPSSIKPFEAVSTASGVLSGDKATASDLTILNNGGSVNFFVYENMQGTLLPDNTNPWKKTPENLPSKKDLCTYLEVNGDYENSGLKKTGMGYRMYLGTDATTNFDIERNTVNTVRLVLSDKGTLESSWKVIPGTTTDTRTISFSPSSLEMNSNSTSDAVSVVTTPSGVKYSLIQGAGFTEAGLSIINTGTNTFQIKSSKILDADRTAALQAVTWDGARSTNLTIKVKAKVPEKIEADCPGYGGTGSWGWDFYKIAGGTVISYSVTVTYSDGTTKILSTSDYNVTDNTRTDLVNFGTKGVIGNVGSVNANGNGTVKFSYTESGKTVSLTKNWNKISVTGITPVIGNVYYGDDYTVSQVNLKYSNGGSETISYPAGLGNLSTTSSKIAVNGKQVSGLRYGTSSITSTGTFRGITLSGTIKSFGHCSIATSPQGSSFSNISQQAISSSATYYCVIVDADGFHSVSDGTIHATHGFTVDYKGSVSGQTLITLISEHCASSVNLSCGDTKECPLKYDYNSKYHTSLLKP